MPITLIAYSPLQIVDPNPTGDGGLAINNNFKTIADHINNTSNPHSFIASQLVAASVTYAKIQNVSATSKILGRKSAGAGDIEELSNADTKTILAIAQADVAGLTTADSPVFATVKCSGLTDGYVPYHSADATGLVNSNMFIGGPGGIYMGLGTAAPGTTFQLQCPGGITLPFLMTTSDYAPGTTGSGLILGFGAATGNTYGRINCNISGATGAGNLVIQTAAAGLVGFGNTGPTYKVDITGNLRAIKTTEQMRLGYDTSNYLSVTVGATGTTTMAVVGTTPTFIFSQNLSAAALTAVGGFGCNSQAAQTAYSVNAASTDLATVVALCNQIRAALVANGVCV